MDVLSSDQLRVEQEMTLASKKMKAGVLAKALFSTMDLIYGKQATLPKFRVLEVVARVPYQAWEQVAYIAVTHKHETPEFAKTIHLRITEARSQQDNEQWHLLILEEMLHSQRSASQLFRGRIIPQVLAFVYYQVSWLLYVANPRWSYQLNAEFEDHAEHEYMTFVRAHPELENMPWNSIFVDEYGAHDSVADLLRQIGYDERVHKEASLEQVQHARFTRHPAPRK